MVGSDELGPMMAAQADRRGIFTAERRAILGDGLSYNWTIHWEHFRTFEPTRMNYPVYRQQSLSATSCLFESQIKEINHRIKRTEKFWNDGHQAESILQVVTAILSDEEQLSNHFQSRPGSQYDRKTTPK